MSIFDWFNSDDFDERDDAAQEEEGEDELDDPDEAEEDDEAQGSILPWGLLLGGAAAALLGYTWHQRRKKEVRVEPRDGRKRLSPGGSGVDGELSRLVSGEPSQDAFQDICERCSELSRRRADIPRLMADLNSALSDWPASTRTLSGSVAWFTAVQEGWSPIVRGLDVSDEGLGVSGVEAIMEYGLKEISALYCGGNSLGPEGLEVLADGLPETVIALNLDWEFLGGDAALVLLEHEGFEHVLELSCQNSRLSNTAREDLHERFEHCSS